MDRRKDPNQGEGDRESARRYDARVRELIADNKVSKPHAVRASIDELVAKGRTWFERVRARFARK